MRKSRVDRNKSGHYNFVMSLAYRFKKHAMILAALLALGSNAFCASEKTEKYDSLIKSGSAAEIKKAMKKNPDMARYEFEPENDTLLMRAIMYNRDISVIDMLLKAGISVKKENIHGQNALMYACMHSKNTSVITRILEKSTTAKTAVKELNKKDDAEKSALKYAKEFENRRAIECVSKYGVH